MIKLALILGSLLVGGCLASASNAESPASLGESLSLTPDGGFSPVFAPDGRLVYFLKDDENADVWLWRLDLETRLPTETGLGPIADGRVAISPDGHWLAYLKGPVFARQVWLVSLDENVAPKQLTQTNAYRSGLAWRPGDPSRLCFAEGIGDEQHIVEWVLKPDAIETSPLPQLGRGTAVFSPDGELVAMTRTDAAGAAYIDVVRLRDGSTVHRIAFGQKIESLPPRGCYDPCFGPHSKQIIYARGSLQPVTDLYLFDLETGHQEALTHDGADHHQPCFSPDGRAVAWTSEPDGSGYQVLMAPFDDEY